MSSARPRLWVTARLQVSAPGAGDHVAGQLGARLGHAEGVEPGVDGVELVFGEAPEDHVLAVGDPHVDRRRSRRARMSAASPRNWSLVMSPSGA